VGDAAVLVVVPPPQGRQKHHHVSEILIHGLHYAYNGLGLWLN